MIFFLFNLLLIVVQKYENLTLVPCNTSIHVHIAQCLSQTKHTYLLKHAPFLCDENLQNSPYSLVKAAVQHCCLHSATVQAQAGAPCLPLLPIDQPFPETLPEQEDLWDSCTSSPPSSQRQNPACIIMGSSTDRTENRNKGRILHLLKTHPTYQKIYQRGEKN